MPARKRTRLTTEQLIPMVLTTLANQGGEGTVREIGDAIGKTTQRATQLVNELLEKKLLKNAGTRTGGRGKAPKLYALSAKGKKMAAKGEVVAPAKKAAAKKKAPARKSGPAKKKAAAPVPAKKAMPAIDLPDTEAINELAVAVNFLAEALTSLQANGMSLSMNFATAPAPEAPKARRKRAPGKKKAGRPKKVEKAAEETEKASRKTPAKRKAASKKKKAPARKKAASKKKAPEKKPETVVEVAPEEKITTPVPEASQVEEKAIPAEDIRVELDENSKSEE